MAANKLKAQVKCTNCEGLIATKDDIGKHPVLRTPMCKPCHFTYLQTNDLSKYRDGVDNEGRENYCRWCLDGGDLILCGDENCRTGWCANCITRNFGETIMESIKNSEDWHCYVCDYTQLDGLREPLDEAQSFIAVIQEDQHSGPDQLKDPEPRLQVRHSELQKPEKVPGPKQKEKTPEPRQKERPKQIEKAPEQKQNERVVEPQQREKAQESQPRESASESRQINKPLEQPRVEKASEQPRAEKASEQPRAEKAPEKPRAEKVPETRQSEKGPAPQQPRMVQESRDSVKGTEPPQKERTPEPRQIEKVPEPQQPERASVPQQKEKASEPKEIEKALDPKQPEVPIVKKPTPVKTPVQEKKGLNFKNFKLFSSTTFLSRPTEIMLEKKPKQAPPTPGTSSRPATTPATTPAQKPSATALKSTPVTKTPTTSVSKPATPNSRPVITPIPSPEPTSTIDSAPATPPIREQSSIIKESTSKPGIKSSASSEPQPPRAPKPDLIDPAPVPPSPPTPAASPGITLEQELQISDDSDDNCDMVDVGNNDDSDESAFVDASEVQPPKSQEWARWALRDAPILKRRFKLLLDSLNESYNGFDLDKFEQDPEAFLSHLDNLRAFLDKAAHVAGRCRDTIQSATCMMSSADGL